jgi:hypothetical protein
MVDLEKHKANFRIVRRFDYENLKWFYYCERREGVFFKTWNWKWRADNLSTAEEYLKRMISEVHPTIIKELYVA